MSPTHRDIVHPDLSHPSGCEWLSSLPPALRATCEPFTRSVICMSAGEKADVAMWLQAMSQAPETSVAAQHFARDTMRLIIAAMIDAQKDEPGFAKFKAKMGKMRRTRESASQLPSVVCTASA